MAKEKKCPVCKTDSGASVAVCRSCGHPYRPSDGGPQPEED